MEQFTGPIAEEYSRCCAELGPDDPYKGPGYVGIHDVLLAHFLIAEFFYNEGFGLGGIGPKNMDLLHSAIYRQHIAFGSRQKWKTFFEVAATLFFGLVKDHPFHDANKRTALLVLLYHLSLKGLIPTARQRVLENFAVEVAEERYVTNSTYRKLARKGDDPEIRFIAKWLQKNTRKVNRREYMVTYRELDTILRSHGFELGNPSGNFIDVNQVIHRRRFFSRRSSVESTRVGRIGFPGMTRQVSKGDLRKIRSMTGLTQEHGYDSEVFYKGADDFGALVSGYQDALRRLADR